MMVDTNVYLSRWPFRRLPGDEPRKLVDALRRHGVAQAWAGSFDGILHKDVAAVNERLAADCRLHGGGMLLPFGTVNPSLADWREDLRCCHERYRMRGIRLHPNYHGYDLNSTLFREVLEASAGRGLVVQIAGCMEDTRMQHPLMRLKDVDWAPLADQLARVPAARVQLLNWKALSRERTERLAASGQVYFDIAMLEGMAGLARLLSVVPVSRVLFGSNSPLFYFDAALLKVREAALSAQDEEAVLGRNAGQVLGNAPGVKQ